MADVLGRPSALAERAVALGVDRRESILIDPAHDFGKNTWHSLEVTRRLGEMVATGWPVLVSLSNKDFVGETLDRAVGERLTGHAGGDGGLRLAGGAGVPRAQRRRDPAGARHGLVDRRDAAAGGVAARIGIRALQARVTHLARGHAGYQLVA